MKTLLSTKRALALMAFTLLSVMSYAQSASVMVTNTTDCYYIVEVRAKSPNNCANACTTGQVCIPPNSVTPISPCGGTKLEWAGAGITPADPNCRACSNLGITIARFCYNFPIKDGGAHCDSKCRSYIAEFTSPTDIRIY
ncbi:MAG TPA: hypothetical protein DCG19_13750 [Cryomorphaceae bacterium]|nr:hypothetical protein [Owenweeksia sp.]MBF99374.1 hypothetical protein [Owenweeksia sp.]HAD98468.1 hypothetical protein [Cryomorphaceae bacterium]HBF19448.1 hypothetical protein [Cryomorphaceae bacterium]HCQ14825.1 hypothetical protein [Cryomorphaceae bacterium]